MDKFIYIAPELLDYTAEIVSGESCYMDCSSDNICGDTGDEF